MSIRAHEFSLNSGFEDCVNYSGIIMSKGLSSSSGLHDAAIGELAIVVRGDIVGAEWRRPN